MKLLIEMSDIINIDLLNSHLLPSQSKHNEATMDIKTNNIPLLSTTLLPITFWVFYDVIVLSFFQLSLLSKS